MKCSFAIIIFIFPMLVWSACSNDDVNPPDEAIQENLNEDSLTMTDTITITIGDKVFTATLEANATAAAFKAMLPLTVNMTELNGNEKFFDFPNNLPTNASNPHNINSGDLMLWGSKTLVIFYKTFSTSYNYTRMGKIENSNGLADALGSGNVTVTFELQP
jgi:hypothetical protein